MKREAWVEQYNRAIPLGIVISLLLATFIEGSYRYWDQPFSLTSWIQTAFICCTVWAVLFSILMRERFRPTKVLLSWTFGLAAAASLIVYFHSKGGLEEYYLERQTVATPNDPDAWLKLAWHYHEQADKLAELPGDDENRPPDPTPSYRMAVRCLDKAIKLGADGFEVKGERAQLALALGDTEEAVAFGREALHFLPPTRAGSEEAAEVKWLREMIARNEGSIDAVKARKEYVSKERQRRLDNLPGALKWVFVIIQIASS